MDGEQLFGKTEIRQAVQQGIMRKYPRLRGRQGNTREKE